MQTVTANPAAEAQTIRWTIDASHSSATFSVRHMMITNVRGEFQTISGTVVFDPKRPDTAKVEAAIDVASIQTRDAKRDEHLRSADFFDAAQFPKIEFVSKSFRIKGEGRAELVGQLTIHGKSREVTLDVEGPTAEHADPWGQKRIGASASTKIRRSDFGMQWNAALEAGGVLVGDEVSIHLDVSLIRQG